VKKFLAIAEGLASTIVPVLIPVGGPALSGLIVHGIESARHMKDDGAGKAAHVIDFVRTGISGVNAVHPGLINEAVTDDMIGYAAKIIYDAAHAVEKVTPSSHITT
jgi:hypothetical protein